MPTLRSLAAWLARSNGPLLAALIGALPGLWFSVSVWGGLGWLDAPYWSGTGFPDSGDVHAGLGAEQHFIRAPWTLPLFALQTIAPAGEALSLLATDAIALTALIGKLLASIGIFANVYAAWFLVVPVLQGAAAGLLAWSLGGGGRIRPFAAALLALSYGHWLQKSAIHPINAGHFTIMIALALCAAVITGRIEARRALILTGALVTLALLQTPYMAAMVVMIGVGTLVAALRAGLPRRSALAIVGATLVFLALALPIGGWTSFAGDWRGGSDDYGNLGANVLALLWPTRFSLAPGLGLDPFRLPVIGGQDIDSEVFIGLAGLILFGSGLLRSIGPGFSRGLVRFSPLLLGAGLAWLFSLTNNIGIGSLQLRLFELPEPIAPLFHAFRWSSRFTWPAAYLLLIGGLVLASRPIGTSTRSITRRTVPPLLALLVASGGLVQALNHGDIGGIRFLTTLYPTTYGERAFAERSLEGASALEVYPAHVCFSDMGIDEMNYGADRLMRDEHTYWMVASGRRGISTTAAKLNRGIDAPCYGADGYGEIVERALADDAMAIALHGRLGRTLEGRIGGAIDRCIAVPGMSVCAPRPIIDDPWSRTAGLRFSDQGIPLFGERPLIEAGDLRMSALLPWTDGFSRRANDNALWGVWEKNEDPRVSETRLPVLAGAGTASLMIGIEIVRADTDLVATLRASGAVRLQSDGKSIDLVEGETIELVGAGSPRCSVSSCTLSLSFEIVSGEIELLSIEARR